MEWTSDMVLELIAAYRDRPLLWNSDNPNFKLASRKNAAWDEIAEQFKTDASTVKRKMSSLLASYRRERRVNDERKANSTWFAYENLDSFLHDRYKRKIMLMLGNRSYPSQPPSEIDNGAEPEPDYEDEPDITGDYGNIKAEVFSDYEDSQYPDDSRHLNDTPHDPLRRNPKRQWTSLSNNKLLQKRRKLLINDDLLIDYPPRYRGDECSAFGHYLACKLREYDPYTRALVQHRINNILFDTDVGKITLEESNPLQFEGEANSSTSATPQTSKS